MQKHFEENHHRDETGRYEVLLPFRKTRHNIGQSKAFAIRRFERLENRLNACPEIKKQYIDFINEYIELGHCKVLIEIDHNDSDGETYVMPHKCVLKPTSSTTRLRVVFDPSPKTTTGVSLNDMLMIGPAI